MAGALTAMLSAKRRQRGFTLAELAITVAIVGILLGGLFVTLSSQIEQKQSADTRRTIEQARDALVGFALANGRLPCPASSASSGVEAPNGGGACTAALTGFVPAATLGLSPTDSQGFLVDAWGNRIRYSVAQTNSQAFTTSAGIRNNLQSGLSPDLSICATNTCATTIASGIPAVIFSIGKNGATGSHGSDEAENIDNDKVFVYHEPTDSSYANGEFDDLVAWLSANVLYSRMAAAGAL